MWIVVTLQGYRPVRVSAAAWVWDGARVSFSRSHHCGRSAVHLLLQLHHLLHVLGLGENETGQVRLKSILRHITPNFHHTRDGLTLRAVGLLGDSYCILSFALLDENQGVFLYTFVRATCVENAGEL